MQLVQANFCYGRRLIRINNFVFIFCLFMTGNNTKTGFVKFILCVLKVSWQQNAIERVKIVTTFSRYVNVVFFFFFFPAYMNLRVWWFHKGTSSTYQLEWLFVLFHLGYDSGDWIYVSHKEFVLVYSVSRIIIYHFNVSPEFDYNMRSTFLWFVT